MSKFFISGRFRAAGIHLLVSVTIAVLAAALVFGLWYPYPYREISGGRELFFIVIAVDVILGPLLTATIFNIKKPRKELKRDLTTIVLLQLLGLSYGLWTVFVARPVHLVFEIDRFRVVHAIEVPIELMAKAPPGVDVLPLWGPTMLAVRPFKDAKENFNDTMIALRGIPLATRPDLWQAYEDSRATVLGAAKPLQILKERFPAHASEMSQIENSKNLNMSLVYLPLVGRKSFWTALLDPRTAEVVAFLPIDSF